VLSIHIIPKPLYLTVLGTLPLLLAAASSVIQEDFSRGMDNWWVEGGERVWVADGKLNVKADNPSIPGGSVATVWLRTQHPADFQLDFDAHVVASSIDANNVNLFFSYSDPAGSPLEQTREARRTAGYNLYHKLNGYIITFLHEPGSTGGPSSDESSKARVRIRRDPGFNLLAETYAYHCRQGVTYHMTVVKRRGEIQFSVDGRELLRATDPQPLGGGLLGLRTYRTWLWWANIRLQEIQH
jgi:hypothetical protein